MHGPQRGLSTVERQKELSCEAAQKAEGLLGMHLAAHCIVHCLPCCQLTPVSRSSMTSCDLRVSSPLKCIEKQLSPCIGPRPQHFEAGGSNANLQLCSD